MTIAGEIQRIKDNISNTYTALGEKGATLPEVQNSANLADTVATVSAGGGGGDNRPQEFIDLDKLVENFDINNVSSWTRYHSEYQVSRLSCIHGILFTNLSDTVYARISSGYTASFKIPDSATLEDLGSNNYKITFSKNSSERWIISGQTSTSGAYWGIAGCVSMRKMNYDYESDFKYVHLPRYLSIRPKQELPLDSVDESTYSACFQGLEDITCIGFQFTDTFKPEFFQIFSSMLYQDHAFQSFKNINRDDIVDMKTITSIGYPVTQDLPNCPFIMDFTNINFSGNTTFYFFRDRNSLQMNRRPIHTKIKWVPNISLSFYCTFPYSGSVTWSSASLDSESFSYLIDNLPTNTSSCTLTISYKNESMLTSSQKSTLSSKNWTISAC